jgi:hypothetical protein
MKESSLLYSQEQLHPFLTHLKAGHKQQANEALKRIVEADLLKAAPYALLIGGTIAVIDRRLQEYRSNTQK